MLRNKGLGLTVQSNVYETNFPNVRIEEKTLNDHLYRTYHTPVGDVSEKIRINLKKGTGQQWRVERMIKRPEDYGVVKFMIEDAIYKPCYENFSEAEKELGQDGVVFSWVGYTPIMQLIVEFMGFQKLAVDLYRHREELEDLISVIDKRLEEICFIVADSPAEIIKVGDNTDSMLINPKLFRDFCLPYFKKYIKILRSKDKIVMSHMDGRLKSLKKLIGKTGLDVIEAFTPPPGGDLSIREARETWGEEMIIWINVPEAIFLYDARRVKDYLIDLIGEISSGKGFLLGITEDIPEKFFEVGLNTLVSTLQEYEQTH